MTQEQKEEGDGLLREAGRSIVEEGKSTLKWLLVGAAIGVVILGGVGGYFFGWTGLGYGLVAGAAIGAFAALWLMSEL